VIEVFLIGVFALACTAFVVALVVSIVRGRRRHRDESWEDEPPPGKTRIRPGAGWGNGGSWH